MDLATQLDRHSVLETVSGFITDVVGEELSLDGPITLQTSFNKDLELESIEFVALAEMLQDHYGEDLDFVDWLSNKELDEIIALTVGDLVEFIIQCQS
jgi:acyl carrier protein